MEHLRTLSFVRTVEDVKTDMVVIFDDRDLTQEEVVNRLENNYGAEFSNMIIITKDQNEIVFRELREPVVDSSGDSFPEDSPGGLSNMLSMMGAMAEAESCENSAEEDELGDVEEADTSAGTPEEDEFNNMIL